MKRILIILFVLGTIVLSACSAGNSTSDINTSDTIPAEYAGKTNPLSAEAAVYGAKIYHSYCETCHGTQGHGDGPAGQALNPKPKNLAELQATVSDDYLFWWISTGRLGTAMVAWKGTLNDEQIWQVITFIRTLK